MQQQVAIVTSIELTRLVIFYVCYDWLCYTCMYGWLPCNWVVVFQYNSFQYLESMYVTLSCECHVSNQYTVTLKTKKTQAILIDAANLIFICEIHFLADLIRYEIEYTQY